MWGISSGCVCECVCMRERERKKVVHGRLAGGVIHGLSLKG